MQEPDNKSRRRFLETSVKVAVVPGVALVALRAHAQDNHVDPESPQAKGLQYTHESPHPDKVCHGCQLWQGGDADWGACAIFPGKQVAVNGWCSAFVAKP